MHILEHINSIDPIIQFISEDSKAADGSMAFLDMLITPTENWEAKYNCLEEAYPVFLHSH